MQHTVILHANGSQSLVDIPTTNSQVNEMDLDSFGTVFQHVLSVRRYCSWELSDHTISIFGSKDERGGAINKHEIPPPEDTDLFYGNILVIKSGPDGDIQSFSKEDYEEFYNTAYGGFESLGSEDSSEDEDEENEYSIGSFVVNDSDPIEYNSEEEEEESEFIPTSEEDEDEGEYEDEDEDKDKDTIEPRGNESTQTVRRSRRLQHHRDIENKLLKESQTE